MRIVIILVERYAVSIFLTSNAKTLRMNCSIEMRIFAMSLNCFHVLYLSDAEKTKKYQ